MMDLQRIKLLLVFISGFISTFAQSSWTKTYIQMLHPWMYKQKKEYVLSSVKQNWSVPHFSQLIFSWNAFRPQEGYFEFSIRARDAKTGKWQPWHKMVEWGAEIQRSYGGTYNNDTGYYHVRLEILKNKLADAFEIKVNSLPGSQLSDLKMISVTTSKLADMEPESSAIAQSLKSVLLSNVPKKSQFKVHHQEGFRICSPTSMSMLIGYLERKPIETKRFADKCFDSGLNTFGSWPFNIAHAFEYSQGKHHFLVKRLSSFKQLHDFLQAKSPVVVSVRGSLSNGAKPYLHGHLLVVIGFDQERKKVMCHDPAFDKLSGVLVEYDLGEFLRCWENSHRLAYVSFPAFKDHMGLAKKESK